MPRRNTSTVALVVLLAGCLVGGPALASTMRAPRTWREVKCTRYTAAWSQALARFGTQGLGRPFLDNHAAFLASGCTSVVDVCPRSDAELALANAMVILAMNAGTASTFPPFRCAK